MSTFYLWFLFVFIGFSAVVFVVCMYFFCLFLIQIIQDIRNSGSGLGIHEKNLFTAGQPQPSGRSLRVRLRVIDLGYNSHHFPVHHAGYVGRIQGIGLRGRQKKSHHIRFIGIERQRVTQLMGLGIFSGRIYDTLKIIHILRFMIFDFFALQRLCKRCLSRAAPADKYYFFHVIVMLQTS